MRKRFFFQLLLVSIGIALLFAGLFFDTGAAGSQKAAITPTPDRLAEPTLPASPTQADKGAQVYWLSCLPCHGDRGQGLTDEFIQTYPVEDRNCWESGCHGKLPYDKGFTLPATIPAVIGPQTLQKFSNASVLRAFIFSAMPYWKPGNLTEEESWQVTAFILRENKLWAAREELSASNADQVRVGPPPASPTPQPDSTAAVLAGFAPIMIGVVVLVLLFTLQRIWRKRPG